MTVTNYSRGRSFEYKVRDDLRELDYYVGRSAASQSPVDLFAAQKSHWRKRVLLVQVKKYPLKRLRKEDWAAMDEMLKWADAWGAHAVLVTKETGRTGWWLFNQQIATTQTAKQLVYEMPLGWLQSHD